MTVLAKQLRDHRRGYLAWAGAIAAVAAMYSAFWPTLGDNPGMAKAIDAFPQSIRDAFHMQDYATPAGYFGSTVFGLLVPILITVFAISLGVGAIAGDEQAGTLDLVLAHPVSRTRLALTRYGAILITLTTAGALLLLAVVALRVPAKYTTLSIPHLAAMCFQLTLFGLCFASIAFGIGTFTGLRTITLGASAYLAVVAYLCDSFLPQISALKWVQGLSPFDWYLGGQPLVNGIQWRHCALLAGTALLCAAIGTWRFHRRDLIA